VKKKGRVLHGTRVMHIARKERVSNRSKEKGCIKSAGRNSFHNPGPNGVVGKERGAPSFWQLKEGKGGRSPIRRVKKNLIRARTASLSQ